MCGRVWQKLVEGKEVLGQIELTIFTDYSNIEYSQGDSGGPVTFKQGGQHTLIGVISGGNPGEEGVAGKMIYYRNWLEKNLGDAVKCRM